MINILKNNPIFVFKSVLCLDGDLPDLTFLKAINVPLIAADGALNKLAINDIWPLCVIGDLDSAKQEYQNKVKTLKNIDQNTNDFEKSLSYLSENNLLPTLVLGMNGGYLDQILNNIDIAIKNDVIIYTPPLIGKILRNKTVLTLEKNTKISLFGNAVLSTKGLKWDLENEKLSFAFKNSALNRVQNEEVVLDIKEGFVLCLIYTIPINDMGI
ncbi:MAG: thiamine diphosphokinase [Proteobacteria bacterium]|nr:thiamine diphosphokinase [Pseudomonadota bacterium]